MDELKFIAGSKDHPDIRVTIYTEDKKYVVTLPDGKTTIPKDRTGDPSGWERSTGDIIAVTTNKDMATPAGTFSVQFVPRAEWFINLSPFDLVEIEMAGSEENMTMIMRGAIDSVTKTESWESGVPQRSITVAGRDFGGLLSDFSVYYIPAIQPIQAIASKIMPWDLNFQLAVNVGQAFLYIWDKLKNYIDLQYGGSKVYNTLLQPAAASMFPDDLTNILFLKGYEGDFWNAFSKYQDKPFHEMFIYDDTLRSYLILRPARLKDALGGLPKAVNDVIQSGAAQYGWKEVEPEKPIYTQDPKDRQTRIVTKEANISGDILYPPDWSVPAQNIINISVTHSMNDVFTNFFTQPELSQVMKISAMTMCTLPYMNNPQDCENPFFQLDPNLPAFIGKYGFRPYNASTVFVDIGIGQLEDRYKKKDGNPVDPLSYEEWLQTSFVGNTIRRNRMLVAWYLHNEFMASGTMTIRGTNKAKIGTYVKDDNSEYYVEGVSHSFQLFQGFTTQLRLSRGVPVSANEFGYDRINWNKYFFSGVGGKADVYGEIPNPYPSAASVRYEQLKKVK